MDVGGLPCSAGWHLRLPGRVIAITSGACFAVAITSGACARRASNPLSGTFAADDRPRSILYLSLTQTDGSLRGYMSAIEPDGRGGTRSDRADVDGVTDGRSVTLRTRQILGLVGTTFTGSQEGDALVLHFPTATGAMERVSFVRTSEEGLTRKVEAWRSELAEAHQKREAARKAREAAEAEAADRRRQQRAMTDAVRVLALARRELVAATAALSPPAEAGELVTACRKRVRDMQVAQAAIKARASGPLACDALRSLQAEARQMRWGLKEVEDLDRRFRNVEREMGARLERIEQAQDSLEKALHAVAAAANAGPPDADVRSLVLKSLRDVGDIQALVQPPLEAFKASWGPTTKSYNVLREQADKIVEETEELVWGLECS
jgi:hypothetical protein